MRRRSVLVGVSPGIEVKLGCESGLSWVGIEV